MKDGWYCMKMIKPQYSHARTRISMGEADVLR
jgi:hypothetical protein